VNNGTKTLADVIKSNAARVKYKHFVRESLANCPGSLLLHFWQDPVCEWRDFMVGKEGEEHTPRPLPLTNHSDTLIQEKQKQDVK